MKLADRSRKYSSPGHRLLLGLLIAVYLAAFLWQAWSVGITFDEPAHLIASYMYWRGEDILTPATTPPLQHLLSGWVPVLLDVPLMRDSPEWEGNNIYGASGVIFRTLEGQRAHWLIFIARLPFVVFPLGIAWVLWRWGSEIFDPATGAWLAIASLLEPNLLAHGSLIKSDVAAAFGLVWIAYACWRFWEQPNRRSLCHLAVAVAVGAQTKFTVLPMVPFALGVTSLRYLTLRRWKPVFLAPLAVLLATYLTLTLAYQFDYSRWPWNR